MALIAGAGNPVGGSNPSGTGSTLNYVGNHIYGMSGAITYDNTETIMMQFDTQESYIVSKIQIGVTPYTADDATTKIYFNDEVVWSNIQLLADQHTVPNYISLLISPATKVKITITNADESTNTAYCILNGRVYA